MSTRPLLPLYLRPAVERRRRVSFGPHVFLDRNADVRVVRSMYRQMRAFGMAPAQCRMIIVAGAQCTVLVS